MSTKTIASALVALCLLSGCDGGDSSQGTATSAGQSDQYYGKFYGDVARGADVLPELGRELSLEDALEELECLGAIGGTVARDEFYALSEIIIREGNREVFSKLLDNDTATVRAMGLLCHAKTDRIGAINVLKAHLRDRGSFDFDLHGGDYGPDYGDHGPAYEWPEDDQDVGTIGCGFRDTIGDFARRLLKDADGFSYGPKPLVSPKDMLRLDLEILADDTATALHYDAIFSIVWANEEGKVSLDSQSLRQLSDGPFYQTVKAVGRIGCQYNETPNCYGVQLFPKRRQFTQQVKQFLIQQLYDFDLDANSRLAAASALTRGSSSEIAQVLRANEDFLNSLNDQALGTRFLARIEREAKYDAYRADLREQDWRLRRREMYALILEMRQCREEMNRDIEAYQGPWDTYRTLPPT